MFSLEPYLLQEWKIKNIKLSCNRSNYSVRCITQRKITFLKYVSVSGFVYSICSMNQCSQEHMSKKQKNRRNKCLFYINLNTNSDNLLQTSQKQKLPFPFSAHCSKPVHLPLQWVVCLLCLLYFSPWELVLGHFSLLCRYSPEISRILCNENMRDISYSFHGRLY